MRAFLRPTTRVPKGLHKSVMALCVTACLAFGSWPEEVGRHEPARGSAPRADPDPPPAMRLEETPGAPFRYEARTTD